MTEAEILFTEILNCNRISLYLNKDLPLGKNKSHLAASALRRRLKGEPLPYILGKTEFMGLEFKVTPDVLIPRPETEILVETVLRAVNSFTRLSVCSLEILELGTGSGCIAVSLAKFLPGANITATDISEKAIQIAKQNALLNNVKIIFFVSDLFANHAMPAGRQEPRTTNHDLIVSNPPYIPEAEIDDLSAEVRYEPRIALDGGKDGLDFYRRIAKEAPHYLKDKGFLIMEMGFGQKEEIEKIFEDTGSFQITEIVKDYKNIERVIVARKKWIN